MMNGAGDDTSCTFKGIIYYIPTSNQASQFGWLLLAVKQSWLTYLLTTGLYLFVIAK